MKRFGGKRNKVYQIQYLRSVLKKDLPKICSSVWGLIEKAVEERLMVDPIGFGKPLKYSLQGLRSLRVSDYRIMYKIDAEKQIVLIVAIGHRRDVYDE